MNYQLDYHYGREAEQYRYVQMPLFLFTEKRFQSLSSDSKILYSLMLSKPFRDSFFMQMRRKLVIQHTIRRILGLYVPGCFKKDTRLKVFMEVISLKYFIGENESTGREFDSIQEFLDAIADLAQTREENGEDRFEIQIMND